MGGMVRIFFGTFVLALWLWGCERTAGTEVGNPEKITVTAAFSVDQPWENPYVRNFSLQVMCVRYTTRSNREGELWLVPGGLKVNWLDGEGSNLPSETAEGGWTSAELLLASAVTEDTWDEGRVFEDFAGPRYIKAGFAKYSLPNLLVELPSDMRYKLRFGGEVLKSWIKDDSLRMEVVFDCGKWLSGLDFSQATLRKDAAGKEFIMLSAAENAGLHAALMERFPSAFNADSVKPY